MIDWTSGDRLDWQTASNTGWWWAGGASRSFKDFVCLETGVITFEPGSRGAAAGLTRFHYCKVALHPQMSPMRFVDILADDIEYGQPLEAMLWSGSCVRMPEPDADLAEPDQAMASSAPPPPATPSAATTPPPVAEPAALPSAPPQMPSLPAGSSICTSSTDGRRVACGPGASICTTSTDGRHVACGGQSSICTTSTDGRDVACGGRHRSAPPAPTAGTLLVAEWRPSARPARMAAMWPVAVRHPSAPAVPTETMSPAAAARWAAPAICRALSRPAVTASTPAIDRQLATGKGVMPPAWAGSAAGVAEW